MATEKGRERQRKVLENKASSKERLKYQNNSQFDNSIFNAALYSLGRIVYDWTQTLSNIYVS